MASSNQLFAPLADIAAWLPGTKAPDTPLIHNTVKGLSSQSSWGSRAFCSIYLPVACSLESIRHSSNAAGQVVSGCFKLMQVCVYGILRRDSTAHREQLSNAWSQASKHTGLAFKTSFLTAYAGTAALLAPRWLHDHAQNRGLVQVSFMDQAKEAALAVGQKAQNQAAQAKDWVVRHPQETAGIIAGLVAATGALVYFTTRTGQQPHIDPPLPPELTNPPVLPNPPGLPNPPVHKDWFDCGVSWVTIPGGGFLKGLRAIYYELEARVGGYPRYDYTGSYPTVGDVSIWGNECIAPFNTFTLGAPEGWRPKYSGK